MPYIIGLSVRKLYFSFFLFWWTQNEGMGDCWGSQIAHN